MAKSAAYWAERRRKTGAGFLMQGGKTLANPSFGNMALLAYKGVKGLRALINSEDFVLDTNVGQVTVANTAYIYPLNQMAQGDGQSQRTGNSILMSRIEELEHFYSPTTNDVILREITFIDKQQVNATTPSVTDLLESSSPTALRSKLQPGRFQILTDKLTAYDTVAHINRITRRTRKLHKHAIYNGTGSTNIQKNGVYKLIICSGVISYNHYYRLHYHDN